MLMGCRCAARCNSAREIRPRLCCDAAERVLLFWATMLAILAAFINCALFAVMLVPCWRNVAALHGGGAGDDDADGVAGDFFACWCW